MFLASRWAKAATQSLRMCCAPRSSMREPVSRRTLYTTPPARASEESDKPVIDSEAVAAFKRTATFQKMSRSPEALEAVRKFAEMMQKQGIDFSSGKPLSMIQMSKLLMNSEFRTGAKELVEAMQKAGIDLTTKEMMEEMANFGKKGGFKG